MKCAETFALAESRTFTERAAFACFRWLLRSGRTLVGNCFRCQQHPAEVCAGLCE
jgi:hypothetical protein